MDGLNSITHLATSSALSVWAIVGNFLALIVLAVALFFFGLKVGRAAFVALVMSLYAGFALYSLFPYKDELMKSAGTPLVKAVMALIIFGVLTFVPYLIIRRIATSGAMHIPPFMLAILATLSAGCILALGYHFFSLASIIPATPPLSALFSPEKYLFWWFVAPIVGFFFLAK